MSPVAQTSSVRMLMYAAGCVDDVISCIHVDVSVSFLQATYKLMSTVQRIDLGMCLLGRIQVLRSTSFNVDVRVVHA